MKEETDEYIPLWIRFVVSVEFFFIHILMRIGRFLCKQKANHDDSVLGLLCDDFSLEKAGYYYNYGFDDFTYSCVKDSCDSFANAIVQKNQYYFLYDFFFHFYFFKRVIIESPASLKSKLRLLLNIGI